MGKWVWLVVFISLWPYNKMAICPGWSLTSSKDSLNSSTDSPSSPNDHVSSPTHSLNLSSDSLDQLQPTNAVKRGIDNKWIDRFSYLDPCHSVGYNHRCSCGRNNRYGHMLSSHNKPVGLSTTKFTEAADEDRGLMKCLSHRSEFDVWGPGHLPLLWYDSSSYLCIMSKSFCLLLHLTIFLSSALGEVLVIQSAIYGRQDTEECSHNRPSSQISNTNCAIHSSKVAEM